MKEPALSGTRTTPPPLNVQTKGQLGCTNLTFSMQMPTTSRIPRRIPIQVLRGPNVA